MRSFDYDLFVIGAGAGAARAARMAAARGVRVALAGHSCAGNVDVDACGLTRKRLIQAVHDANGSGPGAGHRGRLASGFDWKALVAIRSGEIQRLSHADLDALEQSGCHQLAGHAALVGPHAVRVGAHEVSAERILIATGGSPCVPDFPGHEHAPTSDEIFSLEALPTHAVIIGGGYAAVELAGMLADLGVEIELVCRDSLFLSGFDDEVRRVAAREIGRNGILLRFSSEVAGIDQAPRGALRVRLRNGDEIATGCVICASGRRPNVSGLGLDNTAVVQDADSGAIVVDEYFQTAEPSIFAIGDVIGRGGLTPVVISEAENLISKLYGDGALPLNYDRVPTAVFSRPGIGMIGLTESQAMDRYADIAVCKSMFSPLKHSLREGGAQTLIKLIVEPESDRVVGVHMVGPDAGEIIQGFVPALDSGTTRAILDATMGARPRGAKAFVMVRDAVCRAFRV